MGHEYAMRPFISLSLLIWKRSFEKKKKREHIVKSWKSILLYQVLTVCLIIGPSIFVSPPDKNVKCYEWTWNTKQVGDNNWRTDLF